MYAPQIQALRPRAMAFEHGPAEGGHDPFATPAQDSLPAHAMHVHLLDGFRLSVGDEPLAALPHGKAASLLRLLVLHRGRPIARGRLCTMYWPEADAPSARNNLNVCMTRLRRLLGTAVQIRFADEGYQLVAPGPVWVDAEQFERLAELGAHAEGGIRLDAAQQAYEAAAALYHNDLVPDIDGDPALGPRAQELRDRLHQVLGRLASLRESSGDWHGCIRAALRALALDECNEAAHRQLMRCYARLDQPLEVERQYRRCVSVLRALLGVRPSDETTAQYRKLGVRLVA